MLSPLTQIRGDRFFLPSFKRMKLCQGQIWKSGKEYIRIVKLERLAVEYKSMISLTTKEGTLHQTSKKDFCRLLKQAKLLSAGKAPPVATPSVEAGKSE